MGDMPDAEEQDNCEVATPLGMPSGRGTSSGTSVGYDVRRKGTSDATDLEFVEGLRAMKTGMDSSGFRVSSGKRPESRLYNFLKH